MTKSGLTFRRLLYVLILTLLVSCANNGSLEISTDTDSKHEQDQLTIKTAVAAIRTKVARSWSRPNIETIEGLKCFIQVEIMPDGTVMDAVIITTSRNEKFDLSAINAVHNASPLPIPKDKELAVKEFKSFKFLFDPNRFMASCPEVFNATPTLYCQPPLYPPKAAHEKKEGRVKIEFTITKSGTVKDAKIIASYPTGVFDEAALKTINQWRFKEKIGVDGVSVEQRAEHTLLFRLTQ